jgi:hypothetical protein
VSGLALNSASEPHIVGGSNSIWFVRLNTSGTALIFGTWLADGGFNGLTITDLALEGVAPILDKSLEI